MHRGIAWPQIEKNRFWNVGVGLSACWWSARFVGGVVSKAKMTLAGIQLAGVAVIIASVAGEFDNFWGSIGILLCSLPMVIRARPNLVISFLFVVFGLLVLFASARLGMSPVLRVAGACFFISGCWMVFQVLFCRGDAANKGMPQ